MNIVVTVQDSVRVKSMMSINMIQRRTEILRQTVRGKVARGMTPEITATTGSEGFAMISIRPLDPLTIEHRLEASS
jgi:hypothetical protein